MPHRQSDDLSIHGVDVREIALHSAGMRNREFRVHRRVELLFREQAPVVDHPVVLLALQLRAPRPVVEPFVAPEEERRHRAAEAERIAPVVGSDETAIDTDSDLPPAIGPIQRQLAIRREIGDAKPEERVRRVPSAEHLFDRQRARESFDAIEARERESP